MGVAAAAGASGRAPPAQALCLLNSNRATAHLRSGNCLNRSLSLPPAGFCLQIRAQGFLHLTQARAGSPPLPRLQNPCAMIAAALHPQRACLRKSVRPLRSLSVRCSGQPARRREVSERPLQCLHACDPCTLALTSACPCIIGASPACVARCPREHPPLKRPVCPPPPHLPQDRHTPSPHKPSPPAATHSSHAAAAAAAPHAPVAASPPAEASGDLSELKAVLAAAKEAQEAYSTFSQEQAGPICALSGCLSPPGQRPHPSPRRVHLPAAGG